MSDDLPTTEIRALKTSTTELPTTEIAALKSSSEKFPSSDDHDLPVTSIARIFTETNSEMNFHCNNVFNSSNIHYPTLQPFIHLCITFYFFNGYLQLNYIKL
eukprot:145369_1